MMDKKLISVRITERSDQTLKTWSQRENKAQGVIIDESLRLYDKVKSGESVESKLERTNVLVNDILDILENAERITIWEKGEELS